MPRRRKSDVELHPPRSRKARAGTREGERSYVLYAQAPRPGRGALRQEARRGGDRNRAGGGRGGSRALDRGSRRSHLPSAGRARGARNFTCRGGSPTRGAHAPVGPDRKGVAQSRLSKDDGATHRRRPFALPHLLAGGMGGKARRHADDAQSGRGNAAAFAARPPRHDRGRGNLPAVVAALIPLRRGDAAPVPRATELSRHRGREGAFHHRGGGLRAVGKSTTARVLQALLARWPNVPKVDLVTTDGFLYPNAILERE